MFIKIAFEKGDWGSIETFTLFFYLRGQSMEWQDDENDKIYFGKNQQNFKINRLVWAKKHFFLKCAEKH
jgi:hypothetical protein